MEKKKETKSAAFISLGCFKNLVDTEVLGGMLSQRGIRIVSSYENAEWLIINTCGFINDARQESIEEILEALEKRNRGEIRRVAVFGCLPQRYLSELKENFPQADILWGVKDMESLADRIAGRNCQEYPDKNLFLYDDEHERIFTTTPNSTFIKISEGCNMTCSFCAIPKIRGPYRSRSIDSILKEAEKFLRQGVQEINLISQNSTYFGKDNGKYSLLPELLRRISSLGIPWIRVLYMMPEEIGLMEEELLSAFAFPGMIPYFDLPFQHVSPKILQNMNRGGSARSHLALIERIRRAFPEAVIRSTFIVGFPGETNSEFKELTAFARQAKIERFGVFGFSPEENTEAFSFTQAIDLKTTNRRKEKLMEISDENMEHYNNKIKNSIQDFLPLGPWTSTTQIGRIKSQAPEVDGLTQVDSAFTDEYHFFPIKIKSHQHELLRGTRR